jgi:hypothetical protein
VKSALHRTYLGYHLLWSIALLVGHVALHLSENAHLHSENWKALTALNGENSLASWTSIVTAFAMGLVCFSLGEHEKRVRWRACGLFFVYLSLDDGAMLHERIGWLSGVGDGTFYAWTKVVLPFIVVCGTLAFAHLWFACGRRRGARTRLVAAYALWTLAVAVELGEPTWHASAIVIDGLPIHHHAIVLEETCELVAPGVLVAALLVLRDALRDPGVRPAEVGTDESGSRARMR